MGILGVTKTGVFSAVAAGAESIGVGASAPRPTAEEVREFCLGARLLVEDMGGLSPSRRLLGRLVCLECLEDGCDVMDDAEEVSDISICA